jgi:hypothetical protein
MAKSEPVLINEGNGDQFLLTFTDDFASEVELLRNNHEFLAFLKERLKSNKTIPFEQIEAEVEQELLTNQ